MVDLDFEIETVEVARHAATPLLLFKLLVSNQTPAIPVRNVQLRCQLRIEPTRRRYEGKEQELLSDLFGEPSRWGQTLRGFLWTYASAQIPSFDTTCTVNLPVPCSYDFNIAATKYFHGLADGEVPLSLLFSGSIFYSDSDGRLQIDQVPWTKETSFRLPVSIWQSMMEHYYPNAVWLSLDRAIFERLYRYKRQRGLATWEQALDELLAGAAVEAGA
jgi:Family of unknown function (DUF6084)